MSGIWVKICGLGTEADVETTIAAGADAIGVVLAPGSPRTVNADKAAALVAAAGDAVETVAVFRGQSVDDVLTLATRAGVSTVQLHGDEDAAAFDTVRAAGFRVIRAVSAATFLAESEAERAAFGEARLLLDAPEPGSGALADELTADTTPREPWILAGGLRPDNVHELITTLAPAGVDVSSGVEASKGVKDHARIRAFVAAARA